MKRTRYNDEQIIGNPQVTEAKKLARREENLTSKPMVANLCVINAVTKDVLSRNS